MFILKSWPQAHGDAAVKLQYLYYKSWPQAHSDAAVMLQYLYYKSCYNIYIISHVTIFIL